MKDSTVIVYNVEILYSLKNIDISLKLITKVSEDKTLFTFPYYDALIKFRGFSSTKENEENLI